MPEPKFVLVEHENGIVAPSPAAHAERTGAKVIEGAAVDKLGRPVKPVRKNGRPAKPKVSVAQAAEKKAVTPTEGAADTTLTETKE